VFPQPRAAVPHVRGDRVCSDSRGRLWHIAEGTDGLLCRRGVAAGGRWPVSVGGCRLRLEGCFARVWGVKFRLARDCQEPGLLRRNPAIPYHPSVFGPVRLANPVSASGAAPHEGPSLQGARTKNEQSGAGGCAASFRPSPRPCRLGLPRGSNGTVHRPRRVRRRFSGEVC